MYYIVYRNRYESYGIEQVGYFIGYKDKLCDKFSEHPNMAKKFKTLGAAVTRLGVAIDGFRSYEDWLEAFVSDSTHREAALAEVLGQKGEFVEFVKGRIEKISEDGTVVSDAGEEVLEFTRNLFKKRDAKVKTAYSGYVGEYIAETPEGEDFWDGF